MGNAVCKVLELYELWFWGLFTCAYGVWAFVAASRKAYWFDELVTHHVSVLPDWGSVWNALQIGADANPPLIHFLNRITLSMAGDTPAALRTSSMVGFWLACFCLYQIVRKKTSPAAAWIAALFPLASGAHPYAIEARPYGLVLGFTALAYLCWQRRWYPGLGFAVAALVSSHYYAVFATIPFWLVECFRFWKSRRVDVKNAMALVFGYLPLAFYWPLVAGARQYASDNAFAMPSWTSMSDVYSFLLGSMLPLLAVVVGSFLYLAAHRSLTITWRLTIVETVLAVAFCVLPIIIVLIARFVTHGLMPRYTLPAIIGISIAIALLSEMTFSRHQLGMVLVLMAGFLGVERLISLRSLQQPRRFEWAQQVSVEKDLPIVHSSPTQYVEMFHYLDNGLKSRFFAVADAGQAKRRTGSTADDLGAIHLMPVAGLHVQTPSEFLSRNQRFYLLQPPVTNAWLWTKLLEDGADMRLLAGSPQTALYLVTMKGTR
jgi:hypothetical protein